MKLLTFLVFFLTCFSAGTYAQFSDVRDYLAISIDEKVDAEAQDQMLQNKVGITNIFSAPLTINVAIALPAKFNLVSSNNKQYALQPGESIIVPFSFSKQKSTPGGSYTAEIILGIINYDAKISNPFTINIREKTDFRLLVEDREIEITDEDKSIQLKYKVMNIGNKTSTYNSIILDKSFGIEDKKTFTLKPQKDTTITIIKKLSRESLNSLSSKEIRLSVSSDSVTNSSVFLLSKLGSKRVDNPSRFNTFPLQVRTGTNYSNKNFSMPMLGLSTDIRFHKKSSLSLGYSTSNIVQNDLATNTFFFGLNTPTFRLNLGQSSLGRSFSMNGIGATITIKARNDSNWLSLGALRGYQMGKINNKIEGYSLTSETYLKKVNWKTESYVAKDSITNEYKYTHEQEWGIIKKEKTNLRIYGGVGFEKFKFIDTNFNAIGYKYGLDFSARGKHTNFATNNVYYDAKFPGNMAGFVNAQTIATTTFAKRITIGGYFGLNQIRKNIYTDTLFQVNSMLNNNMRYGANLGVRTKYIGNTVGVGFFQYLSTASYDKSAMYKSAYHSITFAKKGWGSMSLYSMANYLENFYNSGKPVVNYTSKFSFRHRGLTLMAETGRQLSNSQFKTQLIEYKKYKTATAILNLPILENKLKLNLVYNYQITEDIGIVAKRQGMNGVLNYTNLQKGIDLNLMAYGYKSDANINTSFNLMLTKTLNMPLGFKRKYYDLKVALFNDANGNGKKDKNEQGAKKASVKINNKPFVADKNGNVIIKNTEAGKYAVDYSISSENPYIPIGGFTRSTELKTKNEKVLFALSKGKAVGGKIIFQKDKNSAAEFNVGSLRVTATDTLGRVFSTLSDEDGSYILNLPSGKFFISLNPKAFSDAMYPKQIALTVDVFDNDVKNVNFYILQKERKVKKTKAEGF